MEFVQKRLMDPRDLHHQLVVVPIAVHKERLQSCHPVVPVAHKLLNESSKLSTHSAQWTEYKWNV